MKSALSQARSNGCKQGTHQHWPSSCPSRKCGFSSQERRDNSETLCRACPCNSDSNGEDDDLIDATDTRRTNRTSSRAIVVVCLIPKSAFSTWARRKPPLMNFRPVCILCLWRKNNCQANHLKQHVSLLTSTSPKWLAKTVFTSVCEFILGILSVSTKCFPVQVPIDCKLV